VGEKMVISVLLRNLYIFTFTPIIVFIFYGIIVIFYGTSLKTKNILENNYYPFISIVVPTHNEEDIISKKIENILESNYQREKMELIFVDDSDDNTGEIIEKFSEKYTCIRLLKFSERMGYSPSMLVGSHSAKGDIIVLTDAHSFFDENTVYNLVRNFQDPSVGAVTGTSTILNPNDQVSKAENLYLTLYNKMRIAETNLDSTFWFKGEAAAVRKSLIEDLVECNATFDTTVALYVRQKGYRSLFDPEVHFYEYAPLRHSDYVKQKTIRAANIIKILLNFKNFIFNPKYGNFGKIIFPMNFFMVIITPLMILMNFIVLSLFFFLNISFALQMTGIYILMVLFLYLFFRSFLLSFINLTYSLMKALYQIFFTKIEHDKVEKLMSTRKAP
jgi:cellulose synthase/poly-beta-1,6-N-acetylglucosamine synthase-like glycosyltransferase